MSRAGPDWPSSTPSSMAREVSGLSTCSARADHLQPEVLGMDLVLADHAVPEFADHGGPRPG